MDVSSSASYNADVKKIKKDYGEKFWNEICNASDSPLKTYMDTPGLLPSLLNKLFYPSRDLYDAILNNNLKDDFYSKIMELYNRERLQTQNNNNENENRTVEELLSSVGYDFYVCETEEDIQQFRKYYDRREKTYDKYVNGIPQHVGEEICTFDGGRLQNFYVFFAIKKNVDEIKRELFTIPRRQDDYGISVISIQFTRKRHVLSIKNRYNHTVTNPDATFSNDLENIVPGLTQAFIRQFGISSIISEDELVIPGYVRASDGKYYKYNYEINNIYYCEDNFIVDNTKGTFELVKEFEQKEKYIIIDYFILDLVNKKFISYDTNLTDSFLECNENISKIKIKKDADHKKNIIIYFKNGTAAYIKIDKNNKIISYRNENILEIGNNFLSYNEVLSELNLPNVTKIGNNFLNNNIELRELLFSSIISIGHNFLTNNKKLGLIEIQSVISIGNNFLKYNNMINKIELPNVLTIGDNFFKSNKMIIEIILPRVLSIGMNFLFFNKILKKISLPNIEYIGKYFLFVNRQLIETSICNTSCFMTAEQITGAFSTGEDNNSNNNNFFEHERKYK